MIVALADEIDSEEALSKFGTTGLGLRDTRIQRQITNYPKSITTAAHRVIMDWVRTKDNRIIAYTEIRGRSRGAPGPGPPLTTKNEAPAPKFYKTEAQNGSFRPVTIWVPPPDQILDPPLEIKVALKKCGQAGMIEVLENVGLTNK